MTEDEQLKVFTELIAHVQPKVQELLDEHEKQGETSFYDLCKNCMLSTFLQTGDIHQTSEDLKLFLIGWAAHKRFGDKHDTG